MIETLFTFILSHFLPINFFLVSGESMTPGLNDSDIIISKRVNSAIELQRKDIVVFGDMEENDGSLLIKRIIGVPGDNLSINSDNSIRISDSQGEFVLQEPYLSVENRVKTYSSKYFRNGEAGEYEVPSEKVFVLGDNRGNSKDSRRFKDTYIGLDQIIGKYIYHIKFDVISNLMGYSAGFQYVAYIDSPEGDSDYFRLFRANDEYLEVVDLDWQYLLNAGSGLIFVYDGGSSSYFDKLVAITPLDLIYLDENFVVTDIKSGKDLNRFKRNFSAEAVGDDVAVKYMVGLTKEYVEKLGIQKQEKLNVLIFE